MAIDPGTMGDAELDQLVFAGQIELARRAALRDLPGQVRALVKAFEDNGGDRQALIDALDDGSLLDGERDPTTGQP